MGSCTILNGVQYKIIAMILLNSLGLIAYLAIMSLLSRRVLFSFLAAIAGFVGISFMVAPWFIPALLTVRWAEQVAFIYGILRSEEHTSELQSLMRISYADFCLKKKQKKHESSQHGKKKK